MLQPDNFFISQCVAETTNLAMCSVELKQILHSIIRPHNVMSTQQVIELMTRWPLLPTFIPPRSLHAPPLQQSFLKLIQLNDSRAGMKL